MPSVDDLWLALVEYRDLCKDALADTLDGPPDDCAIYVDSGPPSWDELPSLIVYAGGPAVADTFPLQPYLAPFHRISVMGEVDLVSMTALILRCAAPLTENNALPDVATREKVSRQTSQDLWAILNHVKNAHRLGTFFPPATERELALDPAVAVVQQGGATGWAITLRVQLGGYRPGES